MEYWRGFMSSEPVLSVHPNVPVGAKKVLLYIVSSLVPLFGIVLGIIYIMKNEKSCNRFGITCLLLGVVLLPVIQIVVILGVLFALTAGDGIAPFVYTLF